MIGGAITTAISWRAAFVFQALIIVIIVVLARGVTDPLPADPTRRFVTVGAILSAVGLVVLVGGIMAADDNLALMGSCSWCGHWSCPGSSPGSAAGSGPERRPCFPPACSATAPRTWP